MAGGFRKAGLASWLGAVALAAMAAIVFVLALGAPVARASTTTNASPAHLGVASCAGSTCHGRSEPTGAVVRQDELLRWQDESSPAGAHARAWRVLATPRSQAIAARLGIGSAQSSPTCLGCHADPAAHRGARFQLSDGVGCEACHGGAENWLASHASVGATHAANVARGMYPTDNVKARAANCLDCHFGSDAQGQFVTHKIMAAGHPRISFELDLFTTLEQHWNEDADYARRKGRNGGVKVWAVGQAMALERSLSLFANPNVGQEGAFPEFYFFDCHTCHRRIGDDAGFRPSAIANPGRPIPPGMPAYNDENMIMLGAVARATAPQLAEQLEADSRAFHAAIARDRAAAVKAAARLRETAAALTDAFSRASFSRAETFAIVDQVTGGATAARYTDYEGSVQAVMATDTLLNALVSAGQVGAGSAAGIRPDINRAYAAVRDPNGYRPQDFRGALGKAATAIRALR